jgi:anti-anti-sigma regulatory factor
MMFTSCGWFFWDVSRPEPVKNLQYAARAIEHLNHIQLIEQVERPFLRILENATSNALKGLTAKDLYLREARYSAPKYRQDIEEIRYSQGVLIKIPFDLVGAASERFQWKLRSSMANQPMELTMDFREVDHIDNYGISAIRAAIPAIKNRGGQIRIYGARDNILELLHAARLRESLVILDDTHRF